MKSNVGHYTRMEAYYVLKIVTGQDIISEFLMVGCQLKLSKFGGKEHWPKEEIKKKQGGGLGGTD